MRQLIIVRKDLGMSVGKIVAQCCHASNAWISSLISKNHIKVLDEQYGRLKTSEYPKDIKGNIIGEKRVIFYRHPDLYKMAKESFEKGEDYFYIKQNKSKDIEQVSLNEVSYHYITKFCIEENVMEQWFKKDYTKTICGAKNKTQLLRAKTIAEELGLKENENFFLIYDNCYTELEPEEFDENGKGKTLTCIGFKPLEDEMTWKISKKYHLL